jgi:predicted transcriptional regulator
MYTYIMQRTQIYLSERESTALDRAAKATGRTRSHLIREAIAARYLDRPNIDEFEAALRETSGAWQMGESGEATVERLRAGRLGRLHRNR